MKPSFTRQNQNELASESYQKKSQSLHGSVRVATKTSIKELNRKLKKENRNKIKYDSDEERVVDETLSDDEHDLLKYKDMKPEDKKPVVKKTWGTRGKK